MVERFLTGRVAWMIGGATGMGRAIAESLSRAGASVAIGSLGADWSNTASALSWSYSAAT